MSETPAFDETVADQLWNAYMAARTNSERFECQYYKTWAEYKTTPSEEALSTWNDAYKVWVDARKQEVAKYDEWKCYAFPPYEL